MGRGEERGVPSWLLKPGGREAVQGKVRRMLRIVASEQAEQDALKRDLDALVREGARRMLVTALKAEVDEYMSQHAGMRDEAGHALVVRNGVSEPRTVTTTAGELEVQAPRVNDRREGRRFTSAILPPWARRSPKVADVLPVLYLRGISTKDFEPALAEFFGSEAGLSASTIQRLTREWSQELAGFQRRDLSQVDYVYLWADGVHFNIRLEEDRLCCLVLLGVRADGHKELVAVGDGFRESTESWAEVLRDLKRRGMRAPMLAIGDGALGFSSCTRAEVTRCDDQPLIMGTKASAYLLNNGCLDVSPPAFCLNRHTCADDIADDQCSSHIDAAITRAASNDHVLEAEPSTGSTCAPPTPSNRLSLPFGSARTKPRAPAVGVLGWRWLTNCSTRHRLAGAASTHPTWSRSFALGRPSWTVSKLSAKTSSTPRDHHWPIHNI